MTKIKVSLQDIAMNFQSPEGETKAISNISLDVFSGKFVSIVGPSGCGKSTILNIISGLIRPSKGEVKVNGRVGYMLQRDHLFEWRTILSNCLIGPEIQGQDLKVACSNVERLLKTYGLEDFIHHYPNQLSGGMRQRAALIRTLAVNPDILLLDEAFSALDYQTRLTVVDEVWSILKKENKTAIIVTHDIAEAISMSDHIVILSRRPAVVKNIYNIELIRPNLPPLENRKDDRFRHYFDLVWKELEIDEPKT
ncbi:ABC transporter related protein [Desulforamulus reducens MI-1]|uniref:ABC transporter related protein n=1 Tax=Desulforamulus reducens (strain ATCC BAA-1160 / DSM 100696 / MI-1) TaxID=349161 RepID=A4J5K7_DESRM|nr:ABC transporter ATP-binding protein [Desulforamulus reducens]ABO50360.1 ABC transporter related protein [Desulforamulus reducens MI-1]